jgi:hypothetical protein
MTDGADASPSTETTPRPGWRAHLLGAFLAWHFLSVFVYILPYPPHFDERALKLPDVQEELGHLFTVVHRVAPIWKDPRETQDEVLKLLRAYMDIYFKVRRPFEMYLELVGSTQSWNMFGGTPPKHPRLLMVEVKPRGSNSFVPFRDFHWGTPEHSAANFRDFKVHEILAMGGWERSRAWYAGWHARLWNREHPQQPAQAVHLYYLELTTPPPAELRSSPDRHPKPVEDFIWNVPPEMSP